MMPSAVKIQFIHSFIKDSNVFDAALQPVVTRQLHSIVVPHVRNALYFRGKVRALQRTLFFLNALYVFVAFSFP